MCSMCRHRGAEPLKYKDESKEEENESSLRLNDQGPIWSCKICQEGNKQESKKKGDFSLSASPMISPTTSLSSSDRSESSCSDLSVVVNSYKRSNSEECKLECAHYKPNHGLNGHFRQSSSDILLSDVVRMPGNNLEDINIGSYGDTVRDVEISQTANNEETDNHCSENTVGLNELNEISCSVGNENEDWLWYPPEPEDPNDDLEGSFGCNDDDDNYGDGIKWGKPGSLSCYGDEGSGSNRFRVKKEKAMQEVVNGKFKAIVNQLLKTEGIASLLNDGENWADIVTSLSWQAASFLKPDAINGKAMDPDGYVKVKCIATGSRNESQLVKGLVFKKRAAHKHMPTKYKTPRLLLIRGFLGQSSSGFSSLNKMDQEKNNLKTIVEMIDTCHPNVVLVEKSVSRDVQESILAKGMTLVYDMKLHRLERVARCTGSPILTSDGLSSQKLKQCDSFYIEKFVEEHAALGEGGKKPSKTLMFIEGCPTRLGCTILLKGSHSEELKRIKSVVRIAVIVAYHLILETSYLVHQKAMFSTILLAGSLDMFRRDKESSALVTNSNIPVVGESLPETEPSAIDIPINSCKDEDGSVNFNMGLEDNAALSYMTYNPAVFSGFSSLSASLKKVIGENFPLTSAPYQSLSNYFGFSKRATDPQTKEHVTVSKTEDSDSRNFEAKCSFEQGKSLNDGQHQSPTSSFQGPLDLGMDIDNKEVQIIEKDDASAVFDSQSILVLMSRRNAFRGTICEQSHFSHIMFYRNFDVNLGKFLQDNLLNQRGQCSTCGELPEAHFYYYAHHNKQLTIRVKRLQKSLPGEAEGKLWMWSCCSKCKHENGAPKSTKRVLISTAACCLSFGKFLELSFSHRPSFDRLSSCGHLLARDFIYYFGLGPMVAMFRYSPVTTYSVSMPPGKLEFDHSIRHKTLMEDYDAVHKKGSSIFQGIADALKNLRSQFSGSILNLRGSMKKFADIEEMLNQEHSEFEVSIHKIAAKNGNTDEAEYKFLRLNWLLWELLLESFVWEQRLGSLMSRDPSVVGTISTVKTVPDQFKSKLNGAGDGRNGGNETTYRIGVASHSIDDIKGAIHAYSDLNELSKKGIMVDASLKESLMQDIPCALSSVDPDGSAQHHSGDSMYLADNIDHSGSAQVERSIPISTDSNNCDSIVDLEGCKSASPLSSVSCLENTDGWFWMPFSEIRQMYMKDLQRGFNPKFQSTSSYISDAYQLISEEGSRLHIPLGIDDYIVRDYDGELSSIIACALTFLNDLPILTETSNEDSRRGGMPSKSVEGAHILTRVPTVISPQWSSTGSDSDPVHSTVSISSEESHLSSFDGLNLLESLLSPENLSPEVCLGVTRSLGKSKYSVICLYAKKFWDLRNRCCPSEFDYIASLSRCKNWEAKGGKSKSFFSKTLDERFIIKEIKKTEFESFVKFAPHYFKYMNESFESGNQTCLAKVLGIYQVIIRQTKSGKEIKHDLMVMENLTFGRNITRQYDLKGALHARYNSAGDSGDVLLDQNFVNDMNSSPLYVSNQSKRFLERAVWNDTTFLNSINVMDYSLLVGVDVQRRELVCGIIDYLRQYTWDKQLETWVKSSLVVPRNTLPTVISPIEYKKRFRKFMATHFLSVPDSWCSKKCSDTCEFCGISDDDSSDSKAQKQEGSKAVLPV
ncbi:hypothetical protein K2173_015219 [Erythroxylum novogranatense]|uniref:1-phosphatidylinositol-3-phosphate 5-kinase n=1 Tax=Erythroxylum novogranatense TaxID=1862640 RepID=A0AAV8T1A9_9ROSI|nr:hypothetical protein K2173_015219 [Erythroxylum novogranatense]